MQFMYLISGLHKTTISYHFTPIRMAIIKNEQKNPQKITSVGEDVEKLEPSALLVTM